MLPLLHCSSCARWGLCQRCKVGELSGERNVQTNSCGSRILSDPTPPEGRQEGFHKRELWKFEGTSSRLRCEGGLVSFSGIGVCVGGGFLPPGSAHANPMAFKTDMKCHFFYHALSQQQHSNFSNNASSHMISCARRN